MQYLFWTVIVVWFSAICAVCAKPPTPVLHTYHCTQNKIFSVSWQSDGIEYKYTLEADVRDGRGWFHVAEWVNIPKGISMTGWTYYGNTQPQGYARVQVST